MLVVLKDSPDQKPRIRLRKDADEDAILYVGTWECVGEHQTAYGRTPAHCYARWSMQFDEPRENACVWS